MNFFDVEDLFSMNQKIRKIEDLNKDEKNQINITNLVNTNKTQQENYLEKKMNLVNSFGTIKAKKIMASMKTTMVKEKYTDTIESVTKAIQENSKNSLEAMALNSGKIY